MPNQVPYPCRNRKCPELTTEGYCAACKKQNNKQYEKTERDKEAKAFYNTQAWRKLSTDIRKKEPLCRECKKEGRVKPATMVDHIIPISKGGAKLDRNNCQPLCWSHHSKKSAQEGSRFG